MVKRAALLTLTIDAFTECSNKSSNARCQMSYQEEHGGWLVMMSLLLYGGG